MLNLKIVNLKRNIFLNFDIQHPNLMKISMFMNYFHLLEKSYF